MRISDWSSDVCSSDLAECGDRATGICSRGVSRARDALAAAFRPPRGHGSTLDDVEIAGARAVALSPRSDFRDPAERGRPRVAAQFPAAPSLRRTLNPGGPRSEEHTSELQSLIRISYAVFCLKKKNRPQHRTQ